MIARWHARPESGSGDMRIIQVLLLCTMLGGCSLSIPSLSSSNEAPVSAARPADQLVGKNIDTLIAQLGQPTRSQPLDNDQTSYIWQIETPGGPPPPRGDGGLYGDGNAPGYVSEGYSPFCRINVVATANGVITQANTEESNGTGTPNGFMRSGNVCEKRLKAKSRA
jgi:hypothetical protein